MVVENKCMIAEIIWLVDELKEKLEDYKHLDTKCNKKKEHVVYLEDKLAKVF